MKVTSPMRAALVRLEGLLVELDIAIASEPKILGRDHTDTIWLCEDLIFALKKLIKRKDKVVEISNSDRAECISLLRQAARRMEWKWDDSASWRVADAGLLLRGMIERSGMKEIPGTHWPTGRRALLPKAVARTG